MISTIEKPDALIGYVGGTYRQRVYTLHQKAINNFIVLAEIYDCGPLSARQCITIE